MLLNIVCCIVLSVCCERLFRNESEFKKSGKYRRFEKILRNYIKLHAIRSAI